MRGSDFAELRAFAAIVEHGSFSQAARHLSVSASAVSQTLRSLEARLGVRLLNRTTRSVALTDAGERLIAHVRSAFAELDVAMESVNAFRETPAGTVRIVATRVAVAAVLEPKIASFCAAYPDIVLDVTTEDATVDIVARGYDAGLRLGEKLDEDMVAVPLTGPLRQIAVASPDYLRKYGRPEEPRDLAQHRCINWRMGAGDAVYPWEFTQADGTWFAQPVDGPLVTSDRALARVAALAGVGITFWEEGQFAGDIAAGRLVPLLERWCGRYPGYFITYPVQRHMSAALRAFIDHFKLRGD